MSNVHFDFQKIGAFTAQDCSTIPNRVAQTTQTFKEQLATLPARDISKPTTTYIFQCKPGGLHLLGVIQVYMRLKGNLKIKNSKHNCFQLPGQLLANVNKGTFHEISIKTYNDFDGLHM